MEANTANSIAESRESGDKAQLSYPTTTLMYFLLKRKYMHILFYV